MTLTRVTLTIRFWSIFFGTDGNQRDILRAYEHGDIPGTRSLEQGDALAEDFGLCAVGMAGQTIGQADEGCHVFGCWLP